MSNLDMWTALVGAVLPALIAKINGAGWSSEAKAATAVVTSLIVAAITAYLQGAVDAADYVRTFLIVFTGAVVTYRTFWQPSGYAAKLERGGPEGY